MEALADARKGAEARVQPGRNSPIFPTPPEQLQGLHTEAQPKDVRSRNTPVSATTPGFHSGPPVGTVIHKTITVIKLAMWGKKEKTPSPLQSPPKPQDIHKDAYFPMKTKRNADSSHLDPCLLHLVSNSGETCRPPMREPSLLYIIEARGTHSANLQASQEMDGSTGIWKTTSLHVTTRGQGQLSRQSHSRRQPAAFPGTFLRELGGQGAGNLGKVPPSPTARPRLASHPPSQTAVRQEADTHSIWPKCCWSDISRHGNPF